MSFVDVKVWQAMKWDGLKEAVRKGSFRSMSHAAANISKTAKELIIKDRDPSSPGLPPHTKFGRLRKAIRYAAGKNFDANQIGAVIGPIGSAMGKSASAHEFGGDYKGTTMPSRPFMIFALYKAAPRLAGEWRGSIGG